MKNDYYRCAGTAVLIKDTALAGDFPDDLASLAAGVYHGTEETGSTTTRSINSDLTSLPRTNFWKEKAFKLDGQRAELLDLILTLTESQN